MNGGEPRLHTSRRDHEHSKSGTGRGGAGGRSTGAELAFESEAARDEAMGTINELTWLVGQFNGASFRGRGRTHHTANGGNGVEPGPVHDGRFPRVFVAGASGRAGVSALRSAVPKPTPVNLRRFAETPIARRAINVIKDRIVGMRWRIQPRSGRVLAQLPYGEERIAALTRNFEAPNPDDSFRSLLEQVLEDVIVGGFGAIELQTASHQPSAVNAVPADNGGSAATGVSAPHNTNPVLSPSVRRGRGSQYFWRRRKRFG